MVKKLDRNSTKLLWSMGELAHALSLSRSVLYKWLAEGAFPFEVFPVRGKYRVVVASVYKWLDEQTGHNQVNQDAA